MQLLFVVECMRNVDVVIL